MSHVGWIVFSEVLDSFHFLVAESDSFLGSVPLISKRDKKVLNK